MMENASCGRQFIPRLTVESYSEWVFRIRKSAKKRGAVLEALTNGVKHGAGPQAGDAVLNLMVHSMGTECRSLFSTC